MWTSSVIKATESEADPLRNHRIIWQSASLEFTTPNSNYDLFNSSPSAQDGCHFKDDIFKCIYIKEKICISIKISLKIVGKGPIGNKPVLVQVMACRRTDDKPLPETMLTQFTDAYMRH